VSARGLLARRPLLGYGLLLVGPPAALAFLGWRGLENEERARRAAAVEEARVLAVAEVDEAAHRLEAIRRAEDARPYYHWQAHVSPADLIASTGPGFVDSPLVSGRDAASDGPRAWFQWALSRDVVSGPDVFTAGRPRGEADAAVVASAPVLVPRLRAAPESPDVRSAPARPVPLRVVAANEEMGQLLEELPVAQQAAGNTTSYLRNYVSRVGNLDAAAAKAEPVVGVRATPFRHLYLPTHRGAGMVVAWRLVWIPGAEGAERRDAPVDRWLLQAYLPPGATFVDPGRELAGDIDRDLPHARLRDRLPIEILDPEVEGPVAAVAPDFAAVELADRDAVRRYVLVAGGLLLVTIVGFYVLTKSVRREVETARRKEDFVAAVTHELKTPLAGIRMYAEMLGEGWVPEGGSPREYAGRIVEETGRLARLVDRVLDLAAVERGLVKASAVPGDLGEAVRTAVATCEPASAEAGVPVRVEVEEGLPLVPFDAALVRQIVVNLVDNAVKYSARSATKDVLVSVRRDGDDVALAVADRGVGIEPEDRPRLFAPFQRGGREETRTAPGVGLGLALVKRYAEAHRAKVSLESEPGKGTTVTVLFPA
jgi:signal transduction histidine kinase